MLSRRDLLQVAAATAAIMPAGLTRAFAQQRLTQHELLAFEPDLILRGGYFFETSAIPAEYLDPSQIDANKHGVGLGLGTRLVATKEFTADIEFSAMYVQLERVDVKDSRLTNIGPLGPPLGNDSTLSSIGNGRYAAHYLMLGGAATLRWGM